MPRYFLKNDVSGLGDTQMVAAMRFVLASSALVIIFINPSEPDRFVAQTYFTLILYVFYSLAILAFIRYAASYLKPVLKFFHWTDIVWYLALISLSSGTSSIFFFFFFFVVLYTSFTYGFSEGLRVTLFSALSFSIVGYLTSPAEQEFELDRFLLRPLYLTVLGYMMAYWGSYEIRTKRRLALLRDIVALSNPRFGADRTIGTIIELLRSFYEANGCLLIMKNADDDGYIVRKADRDHPENAQRATSISFERAKNLIPLPENYAAVYEKETRRRWLLGKRRFYVSDLPEKHNIKVSRGAFETIAEILDADSFVTVPVYHRKQAVGRIFIFSNKYNPFDQSDIEFLLQVVNQFMPIVENIRLVDHLASSAAVEERKKIARDIHDSIIQPYIGLQLGIESVINFLDQTNGDSADSDARCEIIKTRMDRLRDLTGKGIADLRAYIKSLSMHKGFETNLLPAVRSYAEKFENATGISIEIKADENIQINDRLAAELFQLVAEGLSNVRRHTQSLSATIGIYAEANKIILAIENNIPDNDPVKFNPRSISERVKSLGGALDVGQENQKTIVRIEIPL